MSGHIGRNTTELDKNYDYNHVQAPKGRENITGVSGSDIGRCDEPGERWTRQAESILSTRGHTRTVQQGMDGNMRGGDMAGTESVRVCGH